MSALNQALAHACLRPIGPEVVRVLLRRALAVGWPDIPEEGRTAWLLPGGTGLRDSALPDASGGVAVVRLAASLAEQTWCLLGTEAGAPFVRALDAAVPGVSGILARR